MLATIPSRALADDCTSLSLTCDPSGADVCTRVNDVVTCDLDSTSNTTDGAIANAYTYATDSIRIRGNEEDGTPYCCQFTGMDTDPVLVVYGSPNAQGDTIFFYYDVFELDDINAEAYGREGGDVIEGSQLATCVDLLHGDAGSDTIRGRGGADTIVGGDDGDFLYGGPGDDDIEGNGGDDYVDGYTGNDEIYGHGGDDQIRGGDGQDNVVAGPGSDEVCGDGDADTIQGGDYNDYLFGGAGSDSIDGEADYDYCEAGSTCEDTTLTSCPI